MNDLTDVKVGDTIVVVTPSFYRSQGAPTVRDAEVTKVGRKYLYVTPGVSWGDDTKIDRETGVEYYGPNQGGGGTYAQIAYTPEQYEAHLAATEAMKVITAAGLQFKHGQPGNWPDQDRIALAEWLGLRAALTTEEKRLIGLAFGATKFEIESAKKDGSHDPDRLQARLDEYEVIEKKLGLA